MANVVIQFVQVSHDVFEQALVFQSSVVSICPKMHALWEPLVEEKLQIKPGTVYLVIFLHELVWCAF